MERLTEVFMYEYPEIFKEICEYLDFEVSRNVNDYSSEDCDLIIKTLKMEYRNIWKEL